MPGSHRPLYARDKLAGLLFVTDTRSCAFRPDCGLEFNHPLVETDAYVMVDPESGEPIGIFSRTEFTGGAPEPYRVCLLRPVSEAAWAGARESDVDALVERLLEYKRLLGF
jgi:hypothetical protein